MADPKRPSLTVLGGPMAGTRFVIDESFETVVLGSDESCDFRLALPGVAPVHARLLVEPGGVTIQDAGSDGGLHVNDNPVLDAGQALRNGDIVWLGSPGEADVVMLQCILPRVAASPAPPAPESASTEDETLALGPETLFSTEPSPAEAPTQMMEAPPEAPTEMLDIAREAMGGETDQATIARTDQATGGEADQGFVLTETVAMPPPETIEPDPTTIMAPAGFEDETAEPSVTFPEESTGMLVVDAADVPTPSFEAPGEEPTVFYSGSELEPTVAMPLESPEIFSPAEPAPPPPEPPKTTALPKAEAAPRAPRPARPETPRAAKPAAPAPAPRPAAKPRPPAAEAAPRPPASGGAPVGRYAAIGLGALVVIGVGAWGAMRFLGSKPTAPRPTPTPAAVAQATPLPPPITQAAVPTPEPVATPEPAATPTPLAATPPPVATTPTPTPRATPSPSASPSPRRGASPAPAGTPVAPSADAVRAGQVASLLGQGDASMAARQYEAAISHYDEVLRLDPGNARASTNRTSAVALRDSARKRFVVGRTAVKTAKATGDLSGFDTGDVALQKAPDFSGRIDFEMSPASGIKAGDGYSLKIVLVNEGKKPIRIQGLAVNTVVNGTASSPPTAARVREVLPQQRVELGEVAGSWADGTTSWSAEVLVTANKGDSLKNTITWR